MPQTVGGISSVDFKIEGGVNGTVWVDYGGQAAKFTPTGGDRMTGEVNTAVGDLPVVTFGKRGSTDIAIEFLYTEITAELYLVISAVHLAGTVFYWRFSPKGGATGQRLFTTLVGKFLSVPEPVMDQSTGAPVMITAVFKTSGVTESTAA